jgi:hypothetical protein
MSSPCSHGLIKASYSKHRNAILAALGIQSTATQKSRRSTATFRPLNGGQRDRNDEMFISIIYLLAGPVQHLFKST